MLKRKYQHTVVLGEQFLKDTGNEYVVVNQRPYIDKKGKLDNGIKFTLQITKDSGIYKDNEDNMIYENFVVDVLCGTHNLGLKKGDLVELVDFLPDVSYYIDFNYILRFGNIKKIEKKNSIKNPAIDL